MRNAHPTISIFPHVQYTHWFKHRANRQCSEWCGPVAVWLQYTASYGPPTCLSGRGQWLHAVHLARSCQPQHPPPPALSPSQPARAGHWVTDYRSSGTVSDSIVTATGPWPQGRRLYVFKVFIEYPFNFSSDRISMFSVKLTFYKILNFLLMM